jgi:CP family cyanate transporter-like MFS transporter
VLADTADGPQLNEQRHPGALLLIAVVALSMNLRTVIASLPPLLPTVRSALGLSGLTAGLLTTLPLLCFGLLALAAPRVARRVAMERLLLACLVLTGIGAALRGVSGAAGLFAGSVLSGAAVAVGQAVLPILLRTRHPRTVATLTGAYGMALPLGATLAGGVSVPLSHLLPGGWPSSLAFWILPAAATAPLWLLAEGRRATTLEPAPAEPLRAERQAWAVAGYFAFQSMAFYSGLTWLPAILQSGGWGPAAAGWLQALASLVSVATAFAVPALAGRRPGQRWLLVSVVGLAAAGIVGLLAAPGASVTWMVLIGLGQGGCLGLGLILPVLRGGRPAVVASLTAMMLSFGYSTAAIGPWLLGAVHDASGGWTLGVWVFLALTLLALLPGLSATRPGVVRA